MKTPTIVSLALVCFAASLTAQDSAPSQSYRPLPNEVQSAHAREEAPGVYFRRASGSVVTLGPLSARERQILSRRVSGVSGAQRIDGVTRALPATKAFAKHALPGGKAIQQVRFRSPGAKALRLHFVNFNAGAGRVWVYGTAEQAALVYEGTGIDDSGDFWSGLIHGEEAVVEYEYDDRASAAEVPFGVTEAAHLALNTDIPEAAPCHNDANCANERWRAPSRGVAWMSYRVGGQWSSCTGSLINTAPFSGRRLFLTAAHCISTQEQARTLETFWGYESEFCNGPVRHPSQAGRAQGARLLVAGGWNFGDYALLELDRLPDQEVTFNGWNTAEPSFGQAVTGIHHPASSFKRISHGLRRGDQTVVVTDHDGTSHSAPADLYIHVSWQSGLIQGGSSGSPLFNESGQITGVASLAPAILNENDQACQFNDPTAGYGRLSRAFAALEPFLRPRQGSLRNLGCAWSGERSLPGSHDATVKFENRGSREARIVWVDFQGTPQQWATLTPGQDVEIKTREGHLWVAFDSNQNCLGAHRVVDGGGSFSVTLRPENAPPPPPAGAGLPNVGCAAVLYSASGDRAATVEFVNSSTTRVRIAWIDYQGVSRPWLELDPGQRYRQGSFVTHVWRVSDMGGSCRGQFVVNAPGDFQAVIR